MISVIKIQLSAWETDMFRCTVKVHITSWVLPKNIFSNFIIDENEQ